MPTRHVNMKRMKLSDMNPSEYNPRVIDDVAKAGLASSIDEFGLVEPIVVNTVTNNIVGGHQRYNKMLEEGTTETDVVTVELTIAKEKMLNITLNNANITGKYEETMLQSMLVKIEEDEEVLFASLRMDELKLPQAKDFTTSFNLPNNDRSDVTNMTFIVTHAQKDTISAAIEQAISMGSFPDTGNQNKNGNALERIAENFIR